MKTQAHLARSAAFAAALAATPLWAQDTTTETPAEAPAAEAPAADAANGDTMTAAEAPSDLSMGAPAGPEVGQPYIRETYGDWSMRCVKAPEGQDDPCQLYQLLKDAEGNSVAEFSIFPLAGGGQAAAGATIVVPLETLLTANLRIAVDGGKERIYPYSFCNRAGCVARVGFTQAEVNSFKAGNSAKMTLVPAAAPDQKVDLSISLTGFTAGINAGKSE